LYPTQDAANAATYERHIPMLTNFTGSVGSLAAGAPVTLRGIKIGEVKSVELRYDSNIDNIVVAVKYEVAPNRVAQLPADRGKDLDSQMRELVQRGLRAKIETANLITGQKQLAIDLFPHAPAAELQKQDDIYVIPALPGSSEDVTAAAGDLLAQLKAIPFDQIGQKLNDTLTGLDGLVNSGALRGSLTSLQQTMAETQALLHSLNEGTEPLLKRLPSIASSLEETVKRSDELLGSMQKGYGGNSQFSRDASQLLVQLSEAARSIRVLADLLARHPEALIRGRPEPGSP
jgi:paraquat-inducible protein B